MTDRNLWHVLTAEIPADANDLLETTFVTSVPDQGASTRKIEVRLWINRPNLVEKVLFWFMRRVLMVKWERTRRIFEQNHNFHDCEIRETKSGNARCLMFSWELKGAEFPEPMVHPEFPPRTKKVTETTYSKRTITAMLDPGKLPKSA